MLTKLKRRLIKSKMTNEIRMDNFEMLGQLAYLEKLHHKKKVSERKIPTSEAYAIGMSQKYGVKKEIWIKQYKRLIMKQTKLIEPLKIKKNILDEKLKDGDSFDDFFFAQDIEGRKKLNKYVGIKEIIDNGVWLYEHSKGDKK